MTLEALFARSAQGEAFLLLTVCGAGLGALIQLSGAVQHRHRFLGMVSDALTATLLTLSVLLIALRTGAGLRLYALLGLIIGLTLYLAGVWPVMRVLGRSLRRRNSRPRG